MHLLAGLIAGVAGAENGFVDLVLRGTSTPATYYTDFEGTSSATGTNIPLDARGGAIVFVNALVRVTVKSAGGATIREFVDGVSAPAVEVRSTSFNGAAYSGGAVAPGNPTTLQAVLDKWITSAGSVDFKVLIAGVATNLSTAFSTLQGQRRFVITEYGAVGDGVTNCLSAVNAAISAANAAGGGVVYFPPGIFAMSAGPTLFSTVSLDGAGPGLTTVRMTANAFFITTAQPIPSRISGINFTYSSGAYYTWIQTSSGAGSIFDINDCIFQTCTNSGGGFGALQFYGSSRTVRMARCSLGATADTVVWNGMTSGTLEISDSKFTMGTSSSGVTLAVISRGSGSFTKISQCILDCSSVTGGTLRGFQSDGAPSRLMVTGTAIIPPGSGTTWVAFYANGTTATIVESGNELQSTLAAYAAGGTYRAYHITQLLSYGNQLATRDGLTVQAVNPNSANIACPFEQAGTVVVHTTVGTGGTQNLQEPQDGAGTQIVPPDGAKCNVIVWNDTAGAITYNWQGAIRLAMSATTFVVAANSVRSFAIAYTVADGKWFIVSDLAGAVLAE